MKEPKEYLKRQTLSKENKHENTNYIDTGSISTTQKKNKQKENWDSAATH